MPAVDEIHLIHHSHTDIGFSHDQPVFWDLQRRYVDRVLDLVERDLDEDGPTAFRWTFEVTAPLLYWLQTASDDEIERLQRFESMGRIEITAMLANITPLYGPAELLESLWPVHVLREQFGFDIKHAMNGDVTGQNWMLIDALRMAEIQTFSMGINEHFGGAPLERPSVFRWEGPSGETVLALNGYHKSAGGAVGIRPGRDLADFRDDWWPLMRDHLDEIEYDLPCLMLQVSADNDPPYEGLGEYIRRWNEQSAVVNGDLPRLRLSTPTEWWNTVEENAEDIPTYRGDWTDFWNFGCVSSARETAMNRESRRRLLTADAFEAALAALDAHKSDRPPTRRSNEGVRDEAWWALQFYDEHTWGANTAVSVPTSQETYSQWYHKGGYAYDARSYSQLLQRDAVAEVTRRAGPAGVNADE